MLITRSKARSRQTLDRVAFLQANPPGSASASNQNIPQQPSHEGGISSSTQDPGGRLTTSLAMGNERQLAVPQMLCRLFELSRSITFFRSKTKHNRKNLFFHKH